MARTKQTARISTGGQPPPRKLLSVQSRKIANQTPTDDHQVEAQHEEAQHEEAQHEEVQHEEVQKQRQKRKQQTKKEKPHHPTANKVAQESQKTAKKQRTKKTIAPEPKDQDQRLSEELVIITSVESEKKKAELAKAKKEEREREKLARLVRAIDETQKKVSEERATREEIERQYLRGLDQSADSDGDLGLDDEEDEFLILNCNYAPKNPFGEKPKPNPFGEKPKPNPFGEKPKPNPFGEKPKPNPFGEKPKPNQQIGSHAVVEIVASPIAHSSTTTTTTSTTSTTSTTTTTTTTMTTPRATGTLSPFTQSATKDKGKAPLLPVTSQKAVSTLKNGKTVSRKKLDWSELLPVEIWQTIMCYAARSKKAIMNARITCKILNQVFFNVIHERLPHEPIRDYDTSRRFQRTRNINLICYQRPLTMCGFMTFMDKYYLDTVCESLTALVLGRPDRYSVFDAAGLLYYLSTHFTKGEIMFYLFQKSSGKRPIPTDLLLASLGDEDSNSPAIFTPEMWYGSDADGKYGNKINTRKEARKMYPFLPLLYRWLLYPAHYKIKPAQWFMVAEHFRVANQDLTDLPLLLMMLFTSQPMVRITGLDSVQIGYVYEERGVVFPHNNPESHAPGVPRAPVNISTWEENVRLVKMDFLSLKQAVQHYHIGHQYLLVGLGAFLLGEDFVEYDTKSKTFLRTLQYAVMKYDYIWSYELVTPRTWLVERGIDWVVEHGPNYPPNMPVAAPNSDQPAEGSVENPLVI